jgi:hypothetical protein
MGYRGEMTGHGFRGLASTIVIVRFDHTDIKRALEKAVARSVSASALIANSNRGEEKQCLRTAASLRDSRGMDLGSG